MAWSQGQSNDEINHFLQTALMIVVLFFSLNKNIISVLQIKSKSNIAESEYKRS